MYYKQWNYDHFMIILIPVSNNLSFEFNLSVFIFCLQISQEWLAHGFNFRYISNLASLNPLYFRTTFVPIFFLVLVVIDEDCYSTLHSFSSFHFDFQLE